MRLTSSPAHFDLRRPVQENWLLLSKNPRDAIKQLDSGPGASLDSFRKLQAENQKLGDRLNYARQRVNLLSQELGAMGPPSQRQVVALGRQRLAVQRLEERQKKLQQQTALVRAELYRAGISAKDDAGSNCPFSP